MANEPITREEMLLNAVATGEVANLEPITREEMFLAKLGGADVTTPIPITRKEQFLQKAIEGGSGGSGGSGVTGEFVLCGEATEVADNAFSENKAITGIDLPKAAKIGDKAFFMCSNLRNVKTKNNVTIGDYAFQHTAIQTIKLNYAILGKGAFSSCPELMRIESDALGSYTLMEVAEATFSGCVKLESIEGVGLIRVLPSYVFERCNAFKLPDIPYVERIEAYACNDCISATNLNAIAVVTIGEAAFENCTSLNFIDTPVLESIGERAFENCTSLASVDLPMATSISDGAFYGCTNLSALILRNAETVCQISVTAVLNTKIVTAEGAPTGEGFIYVPTALFEDYVSNFVMQIVAGFGLDEATAEYIARAILRKIEDYPEICG